MDPLLTLRVDLPFQREVKKVTAPTLTMID
jgi:hypothetical protein